MSWIQITATLDQCPEDWSLLIDLFSEHGIENTMQTDQPPSLTGCVVDVEGAQERVRELKAALLERGVSSVATSALEEENWEEYWKQFFKPRRVGQRLVVRPTWEPYESQPEDIVITLDPGQAFGTGDHPTTRLCLELLEGEGLKDKSVADLGCGSGILSVAACRLGASEVAAIDIEPLSVEVAKENAALNDVSYHAVAGGSLTAVQGPSEGWDVVISNIISATLIRLALHVSEHLKPGGRWIVSGIIDGNWPDVQRAAKACGFSLVEERKEGEWVAATFLL